MTDPRLALCLLVTLCFGFGYAVAIPVGMAL